MQSSPRDCHLLNAIAATAGPYLRGPNHVRRERPDGRQTAGDVCLFVLRCRPSVCLFERRSDTRTRTTIQIELGAAGLSGAPATQLQWNETDRFGWNRAANESAAETSNSKHRIIFLLVEALTAGLSYAPQVTEETDTQRHRGRLRPPTARRRR